MLSITLYRKHIHTDQYLQWDSHHLSATYSVISTPPTEPEQCVAIQNSSKKKWSISGRLSPIVNTQSGLWTRWGKDLPGQLLRLVMELTARVPQVPNPLPMKLKPRVILLCHTPRVSAKALKDLWDVWYTNPLQR